MAPTYHKNWRCVLSDRKQSRWNIIVKENRISEIEIESWMRTERATNQRQFEEGLSGGRLRHAITVNRKGPSWHPSGRPNWDQALGYHGDKTDAAITELTQHGEHHELSRIMPSCRPVTHILPPFHLYRENYTVIPLMHGEPHHCKRL